MYTVTITFTLAGTDVGPFNLYSDADGYTTPFATGISRTALLAGYTSTVVPDGSTTILAMSTGTCVRDLYMPIVGAPSTTTTTTSSTSSSTTTTTTTAVPAPPNSFFISPSNISGPDACSQEQTTIVYSYNYTYLVDGDILYNINATPFNGTGHIYWANVNYGNISSVGLVSVTGTC